MVLNLLGVSLFFNACVRLIKISISSKSFVFLASASHNSVILMLSPITAMVSWPQLPSSF